MTDKHMENTTSTSSTFDLRDSRLDYMNKMTHNKPMKKSSRLNRLEFKLRSLCYTTAGYIHDLMNTKDSSNLEETQDDLLKVCMEADISKYQYSCAVEHIETCQQLLGVDSTDDVYLELFNSRYEQLKQEKLELEALCLNIMNDGVSSHLKNRIKRRWLRLSRKMSSLKYRLELNHFDKIQEFKTTAMQYFDALGKRTDYYYKILNKKFDKLCGVIQDLKEQVIAYLSDGPAQAYNDFVQTFRPIYEVADAAAVFVEAIPESATDVTVEESSFPPMLRQIFDSDHNMNKFLRSVPEILEMDDDYDFPHGVEIETRITEQGIEQEREIDNESKIAPSKMFPTADVPNRISVVFPVEKYQPLVADVMDGGFIDVLRFFHNMDEAFEPVCMQYRTNTHSLLPVYGFDVRNDHHQAGRPKRVASSIQEVKCLTLRMRRVNKFIFYFKAPKIIMDYIVGRPVDFSTLFESHVKEDITLHCPEISTQVHSPKTLGFTTDQRTARNNLMVATRSQCTVNFPGVMSYDLDSIYEGTISYGLKLRTEFLWRHYYDATNLRL